MARKSSKRGKKSVKPRRKPAPKPAGKSTGRRKSKLKAKPAARAKPVRRKTAARKAAPKRAAAKLRKPAKAKPRRLATKAKAPAPRPATAAPKQLPAKSSTYDAVYARSLSDPEGFWAEAAEGIDWIFKWDQVVDRSNAPFYRWFVGGELNTCHNALDRHVDRGPRRAGRHHLRQPGHQHGQDLSPIRQLTDEVARFAGALAQLGVRQGRPGHHLHADGAGGDHRHARLRADRRHPFRRVRRLRGQRTGDAHRRRQAEGDRLGLLRRRGQSHHSLQAAARCRDRRSPPPAAALHDPAAADGKGRAHARPRRRLGRSCGQGASPRIACRSRRPIRSISSTPRAPPASRRAWCATMAAMRWRSTGRCRTSTACARARSTGRRRTWAGWSAIPTSSMRRCSMAAPPCSTKASRWARPMPAPSGA